MRSSREIKAEFQNKYSPYMDARDAQAYREAIRQAETNEWRREEQNQRDKIATILRGSQ